MNLTRQQKKVYAYIREHRGATTSDIQRDLKIECPSARIAEMRRTGIKIISIGKKKYPGAHAFECYAIEDAPRTFGTAVYETADAILIDGKWVPKRVHNTVA